MSGFYIDASALQAIKHAMGATQSQMTAAFNKALRQTVSRLYKVSVNAMVKTTGAKNRKLVQGRMRQSVKKISAAGNKSGTGRIWMGLDDVPVSALRGRMKSRRGILPQDRKRDVLGRFLPAKGGNNATFTPVSSSELSAKTFDNSFIATIKGKKSIWLRNGRGHVHEARMAVHDPINREIGQVYQGAAEILMEYFEKDLAGRVRGGVHLNNKGKRT